MSNIAERTPHREYIEEWREAHHATLLADHMNVGTNPSFISFNLDPTYQNVVIVTLRGRTLEGNVVEMASMRMSRQHMEALLDHTLLELKQRRA